MTSEEDDTDTTATTVDDGLPHPRVSFFSFQNPFLRAVTFPLTRDAAIRISPRILRPYIYRVAGDSHDESALEEHPARINGH